MGTKLFWICIFGILILALLPRFVAKMFAAYVQPDDIQIAREFEKFSKQKDGSRVEAPVEFSTNPQQDNA